MGEGGGRGLVGHRLGTERVVFLLGFWLKVVKMILKIDDVISPAQGYA